MRGVMMPLIDRRMERDEKMASFLRDLDAKSGIDGPASGGDAGETDAAGAINAP
jgi:hypothetical protein